ncbi:hypothetical protein NUW58_g8967 [Xylaria curta]|uniref:Uncharacterized protein n=1 Tax=Xylaria curta TaxID=42375 RepID=A0ACC1N233_9PEZI|nr:hypothetical protein NUW58_g8967 [Xylaria curta]
MISVSIAPSVATSAGTMASAASGDQTGTDGGEDSIDARRQSGDRTVLEDVVEEEEGVDGDEAIGKEKEEEFVDERLTDDDGDGKTECDATLKPFGVKTRDTTPLHLHLTSASLPVCLAFAICIIDAVELVVVVAATTTKTINH